MKIRTSQLTGAPLDWAVAQCEGEKHDETWGPHYSEYWEKGGPIIEREAVSVLYRPESNQWWACAGDPGEEETPGLFGETALIAAMRCYVAGNLGDQVDVPEELV